MGKKLPALDERTATARSDLMLINSGGADFKETKENFLADVYSSIDTINGNLTNNLSDSVKIPITPTNCSNYSNYGNSYYYKRGNMVFVHVGVKELTANEPVDIGTLPAGYRPSTAYATAGRGGTSYTAIAFMSIFTDGRISISSEDSYAIVDGYYTVFS